MAISALTNKVFSSDLASGKPNSLGTVEVYVAGTSFATLATVYSDAVKTSELTNPVTLNSAGEVEMWVEINVDYRIKDFNGNLIDEVLASTETTASTEIDGFNLIVNGSAELDTNVDLLPDDWTLDTETNGTIAISTADVAHGKNSFAFTGSGSGAGTATSVRFPVLEAGAVELEFTYKTTAATSTNSVKVRFYTKADAIVSTATLYSATTGQPSTFTTYTRRVIVPATATQGELILGGVEAGGTVETGVTNFDDVQLVRVRDLNPVIYDENGNELIKTTPVANAINEVNVTNAITGTNPKIGASGEANTGFIIEDSNGNEVIIAESVASAVNEVTVTNAATGNGPTIAATGTDANINLAISGKGTGSASIDGNAETASKWETTRTIGISGDISASGVNIDGSANVTITGTTIVANAVTATELQTLSGTETTALVATGNAVAFPTEGFYIVSDDTGVLGDFEFQGLLNSGWRTIEQINPTASGANLILVSASSMRVFNVSAGSRTIRYRKVLG